MRKSLIFLLAFFALASAVPAAEFVVAKDGSGHWNELEDIEFERMEPGDVLTIRAGTYKTPLRVRGTEGITIRRRSGDGTVKITQPIYVEEPNITIDGGDWDNFIVETPTGFAGYMVSTVNESGADDFTLRNATLKGNYGSASGAGCNLSLFGVDADIIKVRFVGSPHADQVKVNNRGRFNFEYCEFRDHYRIGDTHADLIQARAVDFSLRMYRCYFSSLEEDVQFTMLSSGNQNGKSPLGDIQFIENVFDGPSIKSIHIKESEVSRTGKFEVIGNTFYKMPEVTGGFPHVERDNVWLESGPRPESPAGGDYDGGDDDGNDDGDDDGDDDNTPDPEPTPTPAPNPTPEPTPIDSEDLPIINVTNYTQVHEGDNSTAKFKISLSKPLSDFVSMDYSTSYRSARSGSDYIATVGSVSFPPGVTEQTIKVRIIQDDVIEDDEQFDFVLSNPINGFLGNHRGTANIVDDDGKFVPVPPEEIPTDLVPEVEFTNLKPDAIADLSNEVNFEGLITSPEGIEQVSLWGNWDGVWKKFDQKAYTGAPAQVQPVFSHNLPDGIFKWSVEAKTPNGRSFAIPLTIGINQDSIMGVPDVGKPVRNVSFAGGDPQGWSRKVVSGAAGAFADDRGLCLAVEGPGENIAEWKSPSNYFPLTSRSIYRVRLHMASDQPLLGATPLWEVRYDNYQGEGTANPGFLNYGGSRWFLDVDGGANRIGAPYGRDYFDVFIAPLAADTPQWNGEIPGEVNHAFTPEAQENTGVRLGVRVLDDNEGVNSADDWGTIAVQKIEIEKFPLEYLESYAEPNYGPELDPSIYNVITEGRGIAGDFEHEFTEGKLKIRVANLNYEEGAEPNFARILITPEDPSQGPVEIEDPVTNLTVRNPKRKFPIVWRPHTLYAGRIGVGGLGTGTDPVDVISLTWAAYNFEIGGQDWITLGNSSIPGGMHLAGSPRPVSATKNEPQTYTSYFHGNNVTNSMIADANRLAMRAEFFNRFDLGPSNDPGSKARNGRDPLEIYSLTVDVLSTFGM